MDVLTEQLMQQLSQEGFSRISRQIGADEHAIRSALSMVMPLLVSALSDNAARPTGARSLQQALTEDHDGSILERVAAFLNNPQTADGAGILRHVLGNRQPVVTQGVAQNTGLEADQVDDLLNIAAPLLMGALGQRQQQAGFDTGGLAAFLQEQQQIDQRDNPDLMGMLHQWLGLDSGGVNLDGVLGMVRNLLDNR